MKNKKLTGFKGTAACFFMLLVHYSATANTYYSTLNGGNWNAPATWSTVAYGNPVNAGTFPVAGDIVYIGDGDTVNINTSCSAASVTIGQGSSGLLQYQGTGAFTLTVTGNLTVLPGAKFWYNSNATRTHTLLLSGNLVNDGIVDLYYDANDKVNISFTGNSNSIVSGSGSWSLSDVSLSKTISTANYLEVRDNNFEMAVINLNVAYGTYIHNNAGSYNINGGTTLFTIQQNAIFKIPQGTVIFSGATNHAYLNGALIVNGGNVIVGSTAGVNGLRYDQTGTNVPYLEISGGSMTVYGGISYASGAANNPFSFKMSGGSLLLNNGTTGTVVEPFLINDVASSSFIMSGGTITIQSPNKGGTGIIDFGICGNNGTVNSTDGIIQFGNNFTPSNRTFNFIPYANAVQPKFFITGPAANIIKLQPSAGSSSSFSLLGMYIDAGKTFDNRAITAGTGDSRTCSITGTFDGTNAFINYGIFTHRTGTVTFKGTTAQVIEGSGTLPFYNMVIDNSNHITLNKPVTIANTLLLVNGKLITNSTNFVNCLAGASSNLGSSTSYVDGPFMQTVAATSAISINMPVGAGSNYHPVVLNVQHSTTASVTYLSQMINSSASGLGFGVPLTLQSVSDVRYYSISRQPVANLLTANLKIYYFSDDGVVDFPNLRIAEDDGIQSWIDLMGTGSANNTGTITTSSFSNFNSKFVLANATGGSNVLPLQLTGFDAALNGETVSLFWQTYSENNIDFYTIERTYNQENFIPVIRVKSFGNSDDTRNYETTDYPKMGTQALYRLQVTDINGNIVDSKTVSVNLPSVQDINIYPSPSDGRNLHLKLTGSNRSAVIIKAYDMLGNEIETKQKYDAGRDEYIVDLVNIEIPGNTCFFNVISGEASLRKKIILTR
jgi:hypothetical protein